MKIEANDKEIQEIFLSGYFQIPRFQRPYSWEIDEVDSFWNDVVKENPESYFIGSMVVYQTKKPYFGIVDGQQRLTTITLIMSALRNAFNSIGEENLALGVHKFIEKANVDNEDEFVLKAETSFPYLQKHIQSFGVSSHVYCDAGAEELKLKKAFEFIEGRLAQEIPELSSYEKNSSQQSLFTNHDDTLIQKLKEIRDKILALKLVFIQLDSEDDAYLIFETLNARGKDLTTSDLVKNLLLKKIQNKNITFDNAKESWNTLVKKFDEVTDGDVIDAFLLHFWVSKYEYTTDKKLFSKVKFFIEKSGNNAGGLFEELHESASLYCKMIKPELFEWSKDEEEIKDHLKSLNIFKVKQQSSFVLALLRAHKNKMITLKNLKSTLGKIVQFHYCFNAITSQRSSGSVASGYSKLAIELSNISAKNEYQNIHNELCGFLSHKLPELDEFVVKFSDLSYLKNKTKYKSLIRYTLNSIFPKNGNGIPVDLGSMTIEHLIPQSKIDNGYDSDTVASIGNLILTDKTINSEQLADKEPKDKITYLKGIGYPLIDVLIDAGDWNKRLVKERVNNLAIKIYNSIKI